MRILMLAQFFPPDIGGEERHVLNLSTTLARRGHDVSVATQAVLGAPSYEVLDSGVRVHRFATAAMRLPGLYSDTDRPHHPPLPDPLAVRALAHVVRDEQPDVVHSHNWIVNSAVALRRGRAGHRRFGLVLTLHDYSHVCSVKRLMRDGEPCERPGVTGCLRCAAAHYGTAVGTVTTAATALMRPVKDRRVDHIVSVSRAVAAGNGVADRTTPSSVIPNFIPDHLIPAADCPAADGPVADDAGQPGTGPAPDPELPTRPFLLFAGDLSEEKGVLTLLRAYEALGQDRPPLLLVGRRHADTPRVLPEGARLGVSWSHDRVLEAFRRCAVAVLPSTWPDPCPTTVLEAMAAGRPVVTTRIGGMIDMVEDGVSGVLVRPGDIAELSSVLGRLLAEDTAVNPHK